MQQLRSTWKEHIWPLWIQREAGKRTKFAVIPNTSQTVSGRRTVLLTWMPLFGAAKPAAWQGRPVSGRFERQQGTPDRHIPAKMPRKRPVLPGSRPSMQRCLHHYGISPFKTSNFRQKVGAFQENLHENRHRLAGRGRCITVDAVARLYIGEGEGDFFATPGMVYVYSGGRTPPFFLCFFCIDFVARMFLLPYSSMTDVCVRAVVAEMQKSRYTRTHTRTPPSPSLDYFVFRWQCWSP